MPGNLGLTCDFKAITLTVYRIKNRAAMSKQALQKRRTLCMDQDKWKDARDKDY